MRFMIFILNCLSPHISNSVSWGWHSHNIRLSLFIVSSLSPSSHTSNQSWVLLILLPAHSYPPLLPLPWHWPYHHSPRPLQSSLTHPPQPYSLSQTHSQTHSPHCRQHDESTIRIWPCSFLPHILIFGHTRLFINHPTPPSTHTSAVSKVLVPLPLLTHFPGIPNLLH